MYRRILRYLNRHRSGFGAAIFFMVLFGATDGVVPFLGKKMMDGIFASKDRDLLLQLPWIIIGFALIRAVADFCQQYMMAAVGHRVTEDIRNDVNKHVLSLSTDFFVKHSTGELLSRVTSDVLLIRTLLTDSSAAVIRDSIRVLVLLASCVWLDPTLSLIAVLFFPLAGLPIARLGKRMRKLSKRGQDAVGQLSALFQESMHGHRVVKIFCREEFEQRRFAAGNEALTKTFIRSERVRAAAGPINEVMASLVISGVLLYGSYAVISGARTPGGFLGFLMAVFLMYEPFKKLTRVNATIQQGLAGAQRIFEILDTPSSIKEPIQPTQPSSSFELEFENVSFEYPARGDEAETTDALKDISLLVPEGRKVALVGF
jgi:subfamily B ATP-binding cassette protein MsbA